MFFIYLRDMVQLVMSPVHGWEDISYDNPDLRRLMTKGWLVWLLVASCTVVLRPAYMGNFEWFDAMARFLATFIKFFVTFYIGGFMFSAFMGVITQGAGVERLNNTLIVFSVGLLIMIDVIKNCLPVDISMINFFPLYVLYIMWRGERFVKVAAGRQLQYVALSFVSVILPPYLIQMMLNLLLPAY